MDVLFHLPERGEDSGGWKRREEQAADKERRDIQRWMVFFICQRAGKSGGFGVGKEERERDAARMRAEEGGKINWSGQQAPRRDLSGAVYTGNRQAAFLHAPCGFSDILPDT